MMHLTLLLCCLSAAYAQYNYNQHNQGQYQPQHHNQGSSSNNGAPVHYVSIGPQLQGDYKFGYNTGNDGSFREETRNPDGSVSGAYGYLDASGKQKVIRYTAGKDGFKAEGEDIPKAPPAPQPAAPQQQPQQYQPQPQYQQYQPQQYQPQQYQPQQYQPQQHYQHQVPQVYSNYIQPQQSNNYPQYAAPQQQGAGSYNPFAYHNPAPGQPGIHSNQLSYSIGGGQQSNSYQG